jgi:hypothetical protein
MKSKEGLSVKEIYKFEQHTKQGLPLFIARIPADYPSPGNGYIDKKLDLKAVRKIRGCNGGWPSTNQKDSS